MRQFLVEVLEIELRQVQKRVLDSTTRTFLFRITSEGREFLLEEGTDQRYGARHLKRAIERNVSCPLSRLLATGQVHQGDVLLIDRHRGVEGLVFLRHPDCRCRTGSGIREPGALHNRVWKSRGHDAAPVSALGG